MSNRARKPSLPTVTIKHPNLCDAGHEQRLKFVRSSCAGLEEWVSRQGFDPATVPAQVRDKLLAEISALITTEKIERIHNATDAAERTELIESLSKSVAEKVIAELEYGERPRRGAKRKYMDRDNEIYVLKREGLSYAQIARRLKMRRNAVQAACRREEKSRKDLGELYEKMQPLLKAVGITMTEQEDGVSNSPL